MKYLLDTHIWIWAISQPAKLTPEVKEILQSPSSEVFISVISVWEFLVLLEKDRLTINTSIEEWLDVAIFKSNIKEVPLDMDIALQSRRLTLPHQDPADRFIAASAFVNRLTLITSDGKLSKCPEISILYNG